VRTRLVAAVCLWPLLVPAPGLGQDAIWVAGLLSDTDFYRLATCGAPPGGNCRVRPLRWDKRDLTVRIRLDDTPLPSGFEARLRRAVIRAIAEVNGTGAGIRLRHVPDGAADITVRPTGLPEGTIMTETPGFSGAGVMGVGFMTVWSDESDTILEAVVLISTDILPTDLPSVMLEEITQSLGFLFDVDGPAYAGVSILSERSNATTRLEGQDARLLRRHYPP
jgi:hypothetical protein